MQGKYCYDYLRITVVKQQFSVLRKSEKFENFTESKNFRKMIHNMINLFQEEVKCTFKHMIIEQFYFVFNTEQVQNFFRYFFNLNCSPACFNCAE